jgi:ubiquinone/menaquinone biosynthesis C-methylase UbiE
MLDSITRFSTRVQNYLKYRPRYPPEIIPLLEKECGLTPAALIADVASGTGFLSELFVQNGNRVIGVEPNPEMRTASENVLRQYSNFTTLNGTAEATTLPEASVDFVTVGQAFHWFDVEGAKKEFARIIKPDGWGMFVWNGLKTDDTGAMKEFQTLFIEYSTDYHHAVRELDDSDMEEFFSPRAYSKRTFTNHQSLTFEGLVGRVLSMSYAPEEDAPNYPHMVRDLKKLFDKYQLDGLFTVRYHTPVYYGRLS